MPKTRSFSIAGTAILSRSDDDPPFQEPWQAQALATALGLQEAGIITATEWSDALDAVIFPLRPVRLN